LKVQKSQRLAALTFEEEKYLSFLREQGVDELSLNTLKIFFVEGNEEDVSEILCDSIAVYCPLGIYVAPLRTFDTVQLNFTFLHETRHFLQEVVMDFLKRDDLPYDEQPQEVDADNFAFECMERGIQFIGPENVVELLQHECPEVFAEWVKYLVAKARA